MRSGSCLRRLGACRSHSLSPVVHDNEATLDSAGSGVGSSWGRSDDTASAVGPRQFPSDRLAVALRGRSHLAAPLPSGIDSALARARTLARADTREGAMSDRDTQTESTRTDPADA